jgi:5'-3' exoribonuclease 1
MGIKFFFKWLRETFPSFIKNVSIFQPFTPSIDHFLIDVNGIIHYCCQKWYGYGAFKSPSSKGKDLVSEILHYLQRIIQFINPKKTVFLAIDGVAPLSKQFQQRSRRYRSSMDRLNNKQEFNSNSITPGTEFFDQITFSIHRWISKKMTKDWNHLHILFSSEKAPGEGEHKLVKWVREYGDSRDSYMLHGMDADLIMLALATHFPHFHILRENTFRPEIEFFHIDMENIRDRLIINMLQDLSDHSDFCHINDFIVMIFLTGNDFLPTIPTIELLDNGVDYVFNMYRRIVKMYGTLTNENGFIKPDVFSKFLGDLSLEQVSFLCEKRAKSGYFPDPLLEKHTKLGDDSKDDSNEEYKEKYDLNWDAYRIDYYQEKFGIDITKDEASLKKICHAYLEGTTWVLEYYLRETPHWKWAYPYFYAPFLSDLAHYCATINLGRPSYLRMKDDGPFSPFLQLLCVLPKTSIELLPKCMHPIIETIGALGFPDECEIDLSGKRHEWEGIVKLPLLPLHQIEKLYRIHVKELTTEESKRNRLGHTFEYKGGKIEKHPLKM